MRKFEDLEYRTQRFAQAAFAFCSKLQRDVATSEVVRQLVRASGSVGANYLEANEAVSRKDFLLHLRIARKESKEARYWLGIVPEQAATSAEQHRLIDEATELLKILTAIIKKCEPAS